MATSRKAKKSARGTDRRQELAVQAARVWHRVHGKPFVWPTDLEPWLEYLTTVNGEPAVNTALMFYERFNS